MINFSCDSTIIVTGVYYDTLCFVLSDDFGLFGGRNVGVERV